MSVNPVNNLLIKFDYQGKSFGQKVCDWLTAPTRAALEGKTVYCSSPKYQGRIQNPDRIDEPIHFRCSRPVDKTILNIALRILAGLAALITAPLQVIAFAVKFFAYGLDPMTIRFQRALQFDAQYMDYRSGQDFIGSLIGLVGSNLDYEPNREAAHIILDKQMGYGAEPELRKQLSTYQGGLYLISAKVLRKQVEKCKDHPSIGEEVKSALAMLYEYEEWSKLILEIIALPKVSINVDRKVEALSLDLKDRIERMLPGDKFLFPVIIKESGAYHAITSQIECQTNGRYSFIVYNLGSGVDRHGVERTTEGKTVAHPYILKDISSEMMSNPEHLKTFVQHATGKEVDRGCNDFYNFIESGQFGKISDNAPGEPSRLQRSGTCIWKSPLEALKRNMSPPAYNTFKMMMKRAVVSELFTNQVEKALKREAQPTLSIAPNWTKEEKDASAIVLVGIEECLKQLEKSKPHYLTEEENDSMRQQFTEMRDRIGDSEWRTQ